VKSERHLFFNPSLCTGCRLCELTCSQLNTGEYNPDIAIIRVLAHPDLGSNLVSIRPISCICDRGKESCVEMCNVGAIQFIDESSVATILKDKSWLAAPVFE
jgi:Fe-S-cluster-containing dehydrogenase component